MKKVYAVGHKRLWKYAGYSKFCCLVVILKKPLEAYEILYGDRSLEYEHAVWNNICALKHHKYDNGVNIQGCNGEIQGVTGGMCQTSGECSLGQTIPI